MAWWFLDCFAFLHNWGWFIWHCAVRRRCSGLFCVKRPICELISVGCQSCLLPIKSSASIMEPYKFGNGFPSVRQTYVGGWQTAGIDSGRRYEGCYVMFLESLFQNVLLEEQRSCQSATGLHDRQFNLKENGGLQSIWQHRTRREKTSVWCTNPTHQHPSSWIQPNIVTDRSMCWYMKPI